MKVKDLISNNKQEIPGIQESVLQSPEPDSVAETNLESKFNIEEYDNKRYEAYKTAKNPGFLEQQRIMRLCYGFATTTVALCRKIKIWPYYRKGTRGVLLSDDAIGLFPSQQQDELKNFIAKFETKLVLFEHTVLGIPLKLLKQVNK